MFLREELLRKTVLNKKLVLVKKILHSEKYTNTRIPRKIGITFVIPICLVIMIINERTD
ncbi:hypothetical protein [Asaccharospora irregularis]|uniref:hypothetical protein n=1 Tax=Asaccharospora irregularis TaxID=29359 RepID=UPI0013565F7A|nr:hypothetical protein [Asaccharospora irregularis]